MKRKLIVFLIFTVLLSTNVKAQCDPWIVNAYKLICDRSPTTTECNIYNYNNGSWNSYAQLCSFVFNYVGPLKGDPWIIQAYVELYQRKPFAIELNTANYNGGSWASFAYLKSYIQNFQNSMVSKGIALRQEANSKGNVLVGTYQAGVQKAINELSKSGGQIVAGGGGNIVAGGGGNIVAGGGGNLKNPVAGGGASSIIAANGSVNIIAAGVNFGYKYTVQSTGTTILPTSGNGAWIIK